MSIKSKQELLENFNTTILHRKNPSVTQLYFKGWTEGLTTTYKTLGLDVFENLGLPTGDTQINLLSTSSSDNDLLILVSGYNVAGTLIHESKNLENIDSTFPVTLTNTMYRIKSMRVIDVVSNIGTIYLMRQSGGSTGGVPNDPADYFYHINAGENVGAILLGQVPPGTTGSFSYNYTIGSIANDSGKWLEFRIQSKEQSDTVWKTEMTFYIDKTTNTQFEWRLDGLPSIQNSSLGYDIRVQGRENQAGSGSSGSMALSLLHTTT